MENTTIKLMTVNELSQFSFYIPSYQRGYRWTVLEVEDLLNDINEFKPKEINDSGEKTWYCLQPIVVKQRSELEYEVIDGQQRLTTLYLILHYLNQDFVESRRDKIFTIDYETRETSKEFLQHPEKEDDSNIDYFYIHKAYLTIHNWLQKQLEDVNYDQNDFRSKLKFYTRVIWYETEESVSTQVFTRLNIGKISLTNAELIKALFLNSSNFHTSDEESMRLRQVEIANEWDQIEIALHNSSLWYFLNNLEKEDNRIEYIFNLMNENGSNDAYSTFRFFSEKLNPKTELVMKENWENVHDYYQRFDEWFHDRELYHKIGFILTSKISSIDSLYQAASEKTKKAFKEYLDSLIKNKYKSKVLLDLDYDDSETRNVLLLYNILTMLQNDNEDSYFPFDIYKLNKWNIEHIASRKDISTVPPNVREQWCYDVKCYIDTSFEGAHELISDIDNYLREAKWNDDTVFEPIFDRTIEHFNRYLKIDTEIDGISNLALLDEKTNKSYKNAVFPLKRKRIIDLDKGGGFVPLCTKNVFLKYFSDYPPKISFWTDDDRQKYEEDLVRVLSDYLEVNS